MKNIKLKYSILLKRLLLLFAIYTLMRVLFFIFNHSYFNLGWSNALIILLAGLRFDLVAITITNILFIALHLPLLKAFYSKWYQFILSFLFYSINSIAIIFNCVDFAYFKFILKRSSADLLQIIFIGNDTANNIGSMAADFWYAPVCAAILIWLMVVFYRKIKIAKTDDYQKTKPLAWLMLAPVIALFIVAFRGGVQYKPLRIITSFEYTTPQNAPLVLNTTFTIIKTFNKDGLEEKKYFADAELEKIFTPLHQYKSTQPFQNLNVVVIILESFGKEYFGAYNNYKGYTPFLDSLIDKSLTFNYSFANSKRSIEGIPAAIASIPALMTEPFITSKYDGNKINSLASLLKQKGYETAFFHGGNNGTMGFDNFTAAAGYDKYYGRNEYGQTDYDGNWGVYDEPFYKFFVSKMSEMKQPFHTAIFSLSSHHPYSIPPQYKDKFPKGPLAIEQSIGYADYALKTFFENASKQNWFDSTLFIITADHTSEAEGEYYKNKLGIYAVPIIYYMHNSNLIGRKEIVTQQASIMPSVLHYLNFNLPFVAFGESVFDTTAQQFAAEFMDDSYQIIANDYLLQYDGEQTTGVYNIKLDSLLNSNLLNQNPKIANQEKKLKAVIQQFNNRLIRNQMSK